MVAEHVSLLAVAPPEYFRPPPAPRGAARRTWLRALSAVVLAVALGLVLAVVHLDGPWRSTEAFAVPVVSRPSAMPSTVAAQKNLMPQRDALVLQAANDGPGPEGPLPAQPSAKAEFGYSRKDVVLICAGIIAAGYAMYYGLQFAGLSPERAGTTSMILINLGLVVGWTGTYIFRVGTKDMTYTKQLKDYEEKVMLKRFEEMTDEERSALAEAPVPKPEDPKSVRRWI
eukprot:EG_transcript_22291